MNKEYDEEDLAFQEKKRAGTCTPAPSLTVPLSASTLPLPIIATDTMNNPEEKARKEMAAKAGGKGPLNTGGQGIKKSGKK